MRPLAVFLFFVALCPAGFGQPTPSIDLLLQKTGLSVARVSGRVRASNELRIRWLSTPASAGVPASDRLQLVQLLARNTPPPRQRSQEISGDHLVVAVLDRQNIVRSWQIIVDPRLIRSELPGPAGNLEKTILHRADVELSLSFPEGIDAGEVRILLPGWDSQGELTLSEVASIKLPGSARQ